VVKPHHVHSLRGSEPTALVAVACEWRYALLVVQARNDDEDDDCIGRALGKLTRMLSRSCEIFVKILNKTFTKFFNVRKFREILHYPLLVTLEL